VIDLFLSPWTKRLIVYPVAINTRWGPARLRAACERDLGIELDRSTAVLFHNRAKDTLVLYSLDADGDRCITKKLDQSRRLPPSRTRVESEVRRPRRRKDRHALPHLICRGRA